MEVSLFDSSPTKRSARCAGPVELCHCLQGRFQKKNEEASRNSFCGSKSHFDTYTHVVLVTHAGTWLRGSLPRFLHFISFGKTILAVSKHFGLVLAHLVGK